MAPTQNQNKVGIVIAGLLLSILMASMDNTIVATAMGTIVGEMGGLDSFIWVTSAYMVAEMAGMPIFGKLSDMYGRKRFFVVGIIVFMAGSALCGTAESILQLSIYRAIQGIGAGAMVSIAFTIMFDVVAAKDRGKMTGMFGAVFGLSSILAPMLGGLITDQFHWAWIFYINLPLGLLAFFLVLFCYKESMEHSKQKIDLLGAVLLVGAVVCLMLGLELGGKAYAWNSPQIMGMFAGFVALAVSLVFVERRAAEPILSLWMFRNRLYTTSNLIGMLSGAAFMTASVYIPIYVQGVLGGSATALSTGVDFKDAHALLNPAIRQSMDVRLLGAILDALSSSIVTTFMWSLIPAFLALAAAFMMSEEKLNPAEQQDGYPAASH